MIKQLSIYFLFLLMWVPGAMAQEIPARPEPPRLVNDYAKQLNTTEIQTLEQKLRAYNDSTSTQIAVVVVPSTEPYTIDEYAIKILREWGVGQKGKDNGIVMLWAPKDRKVFIATGYGMEGAIPDAIAKRIISQVIIPDFKEGMFYRGLDRGVDAIMKYASGEYKADAREARGRGDDDFPFAFVIFLVIFIVVLIIISKNRGGGGGGYRSGGGPIFWPYTTIGGGGHSSGDWGGWGGGGFGGGGGGGGFGGFGGGGGGGGGAGGSY